MKTLLEIFFPEDYTTTTTTGDNTMTYQSKFHGATNNNGSRISVTDWNGKKTYHHYRHEFNAGHAHRAAIEERAELDNVTDPCAVFVSVPSGGYLWATCNEVTA